MIGLTGGGLLAAGVGVVAWGPWGGMEGAGSDTRCDRSCRADWRG